MQYHELIQIISDSDTDQWHRVEANLTVGPELSVWTGGDGEFSGLEVNAHWDLAVFGPDISLTLAWGLDQGEGKAWEGAWVSWATFPDNSVFGHYADLLWCGVPVMRKLGVTVDGGRGVLPAPLPVTEKDDVESLEITGWAVKQFDHALFQLVDGLFYHGDYDRYFGQANFQIE